jgi:hypothetical protein
MHTQRSSKEKPILKHDFTRDITIKKRLLKCLFFVAREIRRHLKIESRVTLI